MWLLSHAAIKWIRIRKMGHWRLLGYLSSRYIFHASTLMWSVTGIPVLCRLRGWICLLHFRFTTVRNPLAVRYGSNLESIIFFKILQNSSMGTHYGIAPRLMPQNLTNEKSRLVQMAWWHQPLPGQWLKSMSRYGVTKSQCVESLRLSDAYMLW